MQENYIIYNYSTGTVFMRGSGPEGVSYIQTPPQGFDVLKLASGIDPVLAETDITYLAPAMWDKVKLLRDKIIDGGFTIPSVGSIDSNSTARTNISGATLAAFMAKASNQPFSVTWTLADNTCKELDADSMIDLGLATIAFVNQCHEKARAVREEIAQAETAEQLLSINLYDGWTAVQ